MTSSKQIELNTLGHLLKLPISTLTKEKLIYFKGDYYNKIINEIIFPIEKKHIMEIKLTKQLIKPKIKLLTFRLAFDTVFGQSIKMTGSSLFLGSWTVHQQLTYVDGFWVIDIDEETLSKEKEVNFEFKYILNSNGSDIWESIPNRKFELAPNLEIINNLVNSQENQNNNENHNICKYFLNSSTMNYNLDTGNIVITSIWNS